MSIHAFLLKNKKIDYFNQINTEGFFEPEMYNLTQEAQKENFSCLSFIDVSGLTIFNQKQIKQLKIEIEKLIKKDRINKKNAKNFLDIIDIALQHPKSRLLFV